MRLKNILAVSCLGLCSCVGDVNSTNSTSLIGTPLPNLLANIDTLPSHDEAKKKFKEEDKERSKKFLDTKPIHDEKSGSYAAVKSIKELLSILPSQLYERYDERDGVLEYDSSVFTRDDIAKGVIAKINPSEPNKIYLNTHVEQRNYSAVQKDNAVMEIAKQKLNLEYKELANSQSPSMSPEKKSVLLDSYRTFITKVMLDDKNPTNGGGTVARDFFFGAGSAFHAVTNANQLTDTLIEENIKIVQSGIAKAITYHGEMASSYGNTFLSSRFPEVTRLATSLYFEIHGKDSPHLTDKTIPVVLVGNLDEITTKYAVSSRAFDSSAAKYVSADRLGAYIAISPENTLPLADNALKTLQDTTISIGKRIEQTNAAGVGDSGVQATELAYNLRAQKMFAEVYDLSNKDQTRSVVFTRTETGEEYLLDPWAGLVVPIDKYIDYYSDFNGKQYSEGLNKVADETVELYDFPRRDDYLAQLVDEACKARGKCSGFSGSASKVGSETEYQMTTLDGTFPTDETLGTTVGTTDTLGKKMPYISLQVEEDTSTERPFIEVVTAPLEHDILVSKEFQTAMQTFKEVFANKITTKVFTLQELVDEYNAKVSLAYKIDLKEEYKNTPVDLKTSGGTYKQENLQLDYAKFFTMRAEELKKYKDLLFTPVTDNDVSEIVRQRKRGLDDYHLNMLDKANEIGYEIAQTITNNQAPEPLLSAVIAHMAYNVLTTVDGDMKENRLKDARLKEISENNSEEDQEHNRKVIFQAASILGHVSMPIFPRVSPDDILLTKLDSNSYLSLTDNTNFIETQMRNKIYEFFEKNKDQIIKNQNNGRIDSITKVTDKVNDLFNSGTLNSKIEIAQTIYFTKGIDIALSIRGNATADAETVDIVETVEEGGGERYFISTTNEYEYPYLMPRSWGHRMPLNSMADDDRKLYGCFELRRANGFANPTIQGKKLQTALELHRKFNTTQTN